MRQVRRFLAPIVLPMLCSPALLSADCNLNGTDDAAEIAAGTARDCNRNGVPDDCDLAPSGLGFLSGGKLLLPYPNDPGPLTLADLDEDGALDVIAVHPG